MVSTVSEAKHIASSYWRNIMLLSQEIFGEIRMEVNTAKTRLIQQLLNDMQWLQYYQHY